MSSTDMQFSNRLFLIFLIHLLFPNCNGWENLPQIPTGRRTQYLLTENNGAYKYGYDTGTGLSAKQSGSPDNQVEGHYFYTAPTGQKIDLKYTAGVQGFTPEGFDTPSKLLNQEFPHHNPPILSRTSELTSSDNSDDQADTGDASYAFTIDTDTYKRQEVSDASGNVKGSYSFKNAAGDHDLSYVAGSGTGFMTKSGSLSLPNGLTGLKNEPRVYTQPSASIRTYTGDSHIPVDVNNKNDGSYSFSYSTGDASREENSDTNGNVQGRYSYQNKAGTHDLSYKAGSATGFIATGGSLSVPNGVSGSILPTAYKAVSVAPNEYSAQNADSDAIFTANPSNDGSYSFSYSTKDSSREETADKSGKVKGKYMFQNEAGNHDLSYVAGSDTGFLVTGGSLSVPNGAFDSTLPTAYKAPSVAPNVYSAQNADSDAVFTTNPNNDGSYSFSYSTKDSSREESADQSGNVKGKYMFQNEAGNHDLSYVAGSDTGFLVTGGSLSVPNGVPSKVSPYSFAPPGTSSSYNSEITPSSADFTTTNSNNDGSYSFSYSTGDSSRVESSDASGNVQGRYSFQNEAGTHDLSYVAGSNTGFLATGGSLSVPNGIIGSNANIKASQSIPNTPLFNSVPLTTSSPQTNYESEDDLSNTGDASYEFSIDTDSYKRHESSDSSGNVKGYYSYSNAAGNHDLSYISGSNTGFVATSGSLKEAPGLTDGQLKTHSGDQANYFNADHKHPDVLAARSNFDTKYNVVPLTNDKSGKISYKLDNLSVKSYLPPNNDKNKFGYVFDSQ